MRPGMRVHAYLHRKEGDQSNAGYWYNRCGATPSTLTLSAEWEALVRAFLEQGHSGVRSGSEVPPPHIRLQLTAE